MTADDRHLQHQDRACLTLTQIHRAYLFARLQGDLTRGRRRHEEGQHRFREAGRDQAAERQRSTRTAWRSSIPATLVRFDGGVKLVINLEARRRQHERRKALRYDADIACDAPCARAGRRSACAAPRGARRRRSHGRANAMQGFSLNRDQPVKIESTTLEVRDKRSRRPSSATSGHAGRHHAEVRHARGLLRQDARHRRSAKAAQPGAGRRRAADQAAEAKGDVVVTQKDQTATGDSGIFDMKANTVTLTGNVVVTQGDERDARRADGGQSHHRRVARSKPSQGQRPGLSRPAAQPGAKSMSPLASRPIQPTQAGRPVAQGTPRRAAASPQGRRTNDARATAAAKSTNADARQLKAASLS